MIPVYPNIRCLIFDCDGTLADTMSLHWEAWQEAFIAIGKRCPENFLDDLKGTPAEEIIERLNESYGYDLDIKQFAKEKQKRVQRKLFRAKPIQPVVEIAKRYRNRFPMAVVSGGTKANVQLILEAIGLADFFDPIITADDPVKPKPSPDIFLEAARRLNMEPQYCQVFEDSDLGIEGARKAGMSVTDVRLFI